MMEGTRSKLPPGQVDGATILARSLQQHGVDQVFTLLGGPIIEAAGQCSRLGMRVIGARHEVAAVLMSVAYNYTSGRRSAVIVAAGPAIANTVTGVQVAYDNCWPVLVIGGTSAARRRGRGAFQETKTLEMLQPITKWSVQVDSPRRFPEYVAMAFRRGWTGRPGPIYLDVPGEHFTDPSDEAYITWQDPAKTFPDAPPMANRQRAQEAAELLINAERPLMLYGKGVRWGNPYDEMRQLVDTLGIPFIPSPMGRGAIPDDHPLCFSGARSHALRNADVIFVVATRVNWLWNYARRFNPEAKVIQLDISPEDLGVNRGVDVPLIGDVKQVFAQLLDEIGPRAEGLADRRAESPWLNDLHEVAAKNAKNLDPIMNSDETPITHHRLMKEVSDVLPRDAIVIIDGHVSYGAARQVIKSYTPASRMNPGDSGCVGVGVPYSLGAKVAFPDRVVTCVTGDSAFGFNAMEMETAVRHNLPVLFVIDTNQGIAGDEYHQHFNPDSPEPVGIFVPDARYDVMMQAFGGHGELVERPQDLRPALDRALASGKAACVNVKTDPKAREVMAGPFF